MIKGYFLPIDRLNEPMREGIEKLIKEAKIARWTNASVRRDGKETLYQADWIKHLEPIYTDPLLKKENEHE